MTETWSAAGAFGPSEGSQQAAIDFFTSQQLQYSQLPTPSLQQSCPMQCALGNEFNGNPWRHWVPDYAMNNTNETYTQGDAAYPGLLCDGIARTTTTFPNGNDSSGIDPRQLQGQGDTKTHEERPQSSWEKLCNASNLRSGGPGRPSTCASPASCAFDLDNSDRTSSASDFQQSLSNSPIPRFRRRSPPDDRNTVDEDASEANEPYNKLLFRCLKSAPNNELQLKDIYSWFRHNTPKGKIPNQKGWQNSIRHNLSMNKAFKRGSRTNPGIGMKNMWHLNSDFFDEVEPTTRFRNEGNKKISAKLKSLRQPAPQRQVSGSLGGRAARRFARDRQNISPSHFRATQPSCCFSQMAPTSAATSESAAASMFKNQYQYAPIGHTPQQCSSSNDYAGNAAVGSNGLADIHKPVANLSGVFRNKQSRPQITNFGGDARASMLESAAQGSRPHQEQGLDLHNHSASGCKPLPQAPPMALQTSSLAALETKNTSDVSPFGPCTSVACNANQNNSSNASSSSTPSLADLAGVHADAKDRPLFETEVEESPRVEPVTPEEAAQDIALRDNGLDFGTDMSFGGWNGPDYFSCKGNDFLG